MKTLIVISHPRKNSLTSNVARAIADGIVENGGQVDLLDLYREEFNPTLYIEDEADYNNIHKTYSKEVMKEIERIKSVDEIIFVFPIYWHSLPAMLKGYIDRVFNYGFAYGGGNKLPVDRIRWIPLAGNTQKQYAKRDYDLNISHQLNLGIANYVGVEDSKVDFIWDSLGENITESPEIYFKNIINRAFQYGKNSVVNSIN